MRSTDKIKQCLRNAELRMNRHTDEIVFKEVVENLSVMPENRWRTIMKSPITKVAVAAVIIYPFRASASKLAELWRSPPGRYLALGVGGYVVARIAGSAFKCVLRSDAVNKWRSARGLAHGALEEPIELWGAIAVLLAAIVFYKALDRPARARPADEHT